MMNMQNKNTRKIVTGVIIAVLVVSMVLPMIISRSTLWMPMGVVICFGTIFAIGFVVTILPVAYWKCFNKAKSGKEETVA